MDLHFLSLTSKILSSNSFKLVEDLKILNRQYFCDKDRMEIKHTRQSQRNKKWTIFVETDGHTFTKLVNTKLKISLSTSPNKILI